MSPTGEGKTITAALAASMWAWQGKPVHVVTVNDYLVQRDAEEMTPIYESMGHTVGHVVHETTHQERVDHYRRNVVYCTSKELVADFLITKIVGKGPMDRAKCIEFWGSETDACKEFAK